MMVAPGVSVSQTVKSDPQATAVGFETESATGLSSMSVARDPHPPYIE